MNDLVIMGSRYRTGEITPEEFWTQAKAFWNIDENHSILSRMWFECYEPVPETVLIVDRLVGGGC